MTRLLLVSFSLLTPTELLLFHMVVWLDGSSLASAAGHSPRLGSLPASALGPHSVLVRWERTMAWEAKLQGYTLQDEDGWIAS